MIMSILRTVAALATLSGIGYSLLCLWSTRWFFLKRASARDDEFQPAVSLLKPLCGADPNSYDSLRSHCVQDYPEFEIIFGVSDPEDVVIPIVRRLMQEFPQRKMQLVICPELLGSNYKVSNLIQMFPHASHDYVLVNDSDIHVAPRYLRDVMTEFQHEGVGMVTCVYRGVPGSSLGSKLEALGISSDFMAGVFSARQLEGGLNFALGSTLAFRRKALVAIGGFESVADYLGDDYELGKRVANAGSKVALATCVVDHYLPNYSFTEYLRHQLRWARSVLHSRPRGYAGLVLTFGLVWAILTVFAAGGAAWSWYLLTLTVALRLAVAFTVGAAILRDPQVVKNFWLIPARDVIALGIWAVSFTGRRVVWRGNEFTLENGKLRS
jgi:ceramide glucosyltransferase